MESYKTLRKIPEFCSFCRTFDPACITLQLASKLLYPMLSQPFVRVELILAHILTTHGQPLLLSFLIIDMRLVTIFHYYCRWMAMGGCREKWVFSNTHRTLTSIGFVSYSSENVSIIIVVFKWTPQRQASPYSVLSVLDLLLSDFIYGNYTVRHEHGHEIYEYLIFNSMLVFIKFQKLCSVGSTWMFAWI